MSRTLNGWPTDPKTMRVYLPSGLGATVRNGDVGRLIRWLGIAYDQNIEKVTTFNGYRDYVTNVRSGGVESSNHRSATAIDINGGKYPYEWTHRDTYKNPPAKHVAAVRALLRKAPELGWGLDFQVTRRDPMHYEIRPGVTAAQVKRRVAALGIGWYHVAVATWGSTKAVAYKVPQTGKANVSRKVKLGKNVYIVYVSFDGKWALTKAGNWIKTSKLKKGKKK